MRSCAQTNKGSNRGHISKAKHAQQASCHGASTALFCEVPGQQLAGGTAPSPGIARQQLQALPQGHQCGRGGAVSDSQQVQGQPSPAGQLQPATMWLLGCCRQCRCRTELHHLRSLLVCGPHPTALGTAQMANLGTRQSPANSINSA